jgi:hypothetical protein
MHRSGLDVRNSNEHTVGPTIDIKPSPWMVFRGSYRHSWRDAPGYNLADQRFFEAKRDRDRVSLFSEITPWETLSFHGGFEFTRDAYPETTYGTQNDFNYSPSVGLIYAPAEWIKFFADYNWDRFDWRLDARSASDWSSRGREKINTITLGTDVEIIRNLLGLRLQYGFSDGISKVFASGNPGPNAATNYPSVINRWHEVLARLEYQVHKKHRHKPRLLLQRLQEQRLRRRYYEGVDGRRRHRSQCAAVIFSRRPTQRVIHGPYGLFGVKVEILTLGAVSWSCRR